MATKVVQAAERLSKLFDRVGSELAPRVWFGQHLARLVQATEHIYTFVHGNSPRFRTLCEDVDVLRQIFGDLLDQFEGDEEDSDWVTIAVRDSQTHFVMGDTVLVPPGTTNRVRLTPLREFPRGSIYQIETESPGIGIVEARVGPNSMIGGMVANKPDNQCSVRSGQLTEPCPVGTELMFDICNHRSAKATGES